jgi:putative transposase
MPSACLVIFDATPRGKKELVGLTDGVRESPRSWKELLLDLKRRGLSMGPEHAVTDGALGQQTKGGRCK